MTNLNLLEIIFALIAMWSFGWAIRFFFVQPAGKKSTTLKQAVVVGLLGVVANLTSLFFFNNPNAVFSLFGIGLYILAIALFWWTIWTHRGRRLTIAFSDDEPQHLVTTGPYQHIRNPFYTAYMLAWLAGAVCTNQWILYLVAAAMFYYYDQAAQGEEKKFLSSTLKEVYLIYQRRTKRFLPWVY